MEQSKPIPEEIQKWINETEKKETFGEPLLSANWGYRRGSTAMYHRMAEEVWALKAALIDIRDNGGGKLCREDRGRMQAIAAKALEQHSSPTS